MFSCGSEVFADRTQGRATTGASVLRGMPSVIKEIFVLFKK